MSSTVTESCGFVRYPGPDSKFTIAKMYASGQSGLYQPNGPFIVYDFASDEDSSRMVSFIERLRDPDGPNTWQILKALFPGAANRIEDIAQLLARDTLLNAARRCLETP